MYGERFDIPQPDELVMIGWFAGGNVFRTGCCFHRSRGKIFYFQPGHETNPTYYQRGSAQGHPQWNQMGCCAGYHCPDIRTFPAAGGSCALRVVPERTAYDERMNSKGTACYGCPLICSVIGPEAISAAMASFAGGFSGAGAAV